MTSRLTPVLLPIPAEKQQVGKKTPVKIQSEWARKALQESLKASQLSLGELRFDERGAPISQSGVTWSLTHKSLWVGAVAARQSHPKFGIGIDIEQVAERKTERPFDYVGNEKEWKLVGARNIENFFRLWTGKEAVLKAVGTGLRDLKNCHLTKARERKGDAASLVFSCLGQDWTVNQKFFADHLVSITDLGYAVDWVIRP